MLLVLNVTTFVLCTGFSFTGVGSDSAGTLGSTMVPPAGLPTSTSDSTGVQSVSSYSLVFGAHASLLISAASVNSVGDMRPITRISYAVPRVYPLYSTLENAAGLPSH